MKYSFGGSQTCLLRYCGLTWIEICNYSFDSWTWLNGQASSVKSESSKLIMMGLKGKSVALLSLWVSTYKTRTPLPLGNCHTTNIYNVKDKILRQILVVCVCTFCSIFRDLKTIIITRAMFLSLFWFTAPFFD